MSDPFSDSSKRLAARRQLVRRVVGDDNFRVTIHARQSSSLSPELPEILKANGPLRDSVALLKSQIELLQALHPLKDTKAVQAVYDSLSAEQRQFVDRDVVLGFGTQLAAIDAELKRQCLNIVEQIIERHDPVHILKDNIPLVDFLRTDHNLLVLEKKRLQHHLDEAAKIVRKHPDLIALLKAHPLLASIDAQDEVRAASAFADSSKSEAASSDALIAEIFRLPVDAPRLWPGRKEATESALAFTVATYQPWLSHPLMSITLLRDLDRNLYQILRTWLADHDPKEIPSDLRHFMKDGPSKNTLRADAVVIKYGIKRPSDAYETFRGDKKTADRVSAHMRNHEERLKALRRRYQVSLIEHSYST